MNYGLYLSASGVLTNMHRQDVFSNNLANVHTVGFKRDLALLRPRPAEAVEDDFGMELSHKLLDRLGGGVLAERSMVDFTAGPIEQTGGPLDVAIEGDGFLAVASQENGERQVLLTRDGRLTRNGDGYLVLAASGQQVLDVDDRPIQIDGGVPVRIDDGGMVWQNGEEIARLQVAVVADKSALEKRGQNMFTFGDGMDRRKPASAIRVRQGFLEGGGVDPIHELMELTEATKAINLNGNLMRYHDLMMDRAVNVLGRIA